MGKSCSRKTTGHILAKNTVLIIIVVASVVTLSITYRTKLNKNIAAFYKRGSYKALWRCMHILLRYLLFSLCMISYFWEVTDESHKTSDGSESDDISIATENDQQQIQYNKSAIFRYTESGLNHFLQVGFTAFWPRKTVSHAIFKWVSTLSVIILPLIQICSTYCRFAKGGASSLSFFSIMKFLRKVVQLGLFIYGVYLGKQYFRRPPIYPKDVKFGKMPWKKYRNRDASISGQKSMAKSGIGTSSKFILFGLLFACFLEAYLMEYQQLNRREGARIPEAERGNYVEIFSKFLTGSWSSIIFPLFVYPEMVIILGTFPLFSFGRKVLKGLLTFCLLISGHVTIVTILSLVIVWEIERFDDDLKYNLIETFEKTVDVKVFAKRRLYIFDQIKIKRDELIPQLSILFHYLIIDRLLFIVFDFWNFTCDQRIDFNVSAFIARHLFQLVLTGWVVLKMALFNVKWPHKLIDTVRRWRLQSWINSVDQQSNSKLDTSHYQSRRYFLDKEYELWAQYLSQERFVKRFGFRIFGYRVDIRWFTLSFGFQLAFIGIGMRKTFFGSASELIC